ANELDRDEHLDWVIGHSLVTNVDRQGSWVSDVMAYDRTGYEQDLVYLETCYLSWVGALYRKSIHDRFGYYDASFRGAGDTEFKSRVMPFIKSKVVDQTLGLFGNYP
ncbi:MAG: family 2 glycosyl transferase, partial [Microcystaceae cyanobacterium]